MFDANAGPDIEQRIIRNAEFHQLATRLNLRLGEVATHGFANVLYFSRTNTELQGGVSVLLVGLLGNDLAAVNFQHSDRNISPVIGENPRHTNFLCDHTGPHNDKSLSLWLSRA